MIGFVGGPPGWLAGITGAAPPPPAPPPVGLSNLQPHHYGGPAERDAYGAWKWPADLYPESYTLTPQSHTLPQESPFTRKRRTVALAGGDRWVYEMVFHLNRVRSQRLEALLRRLKGPVGKVALWDLDRETPLGPNLDTSHLPRTKWTDGTQFTDGTMFGAGAPGYTVYGDFARGAEAVRAYGFPQYTTQLIGSDNVGLGGRLYSLARDAESDGLGIAWLYLHRGLLDPIPHGTPVVCDRPTSPFQLENDDQAARSRSARGLPRFTLRLIEAL
jgi:hypothetical protein